MALKGTIKDFGVADILQLIGQQAKTGVLVLNNDVDEVRVYFVNGSVVRAENASRPEQMLLGTFMVRAEAISEAQLEKALQEQKRTLKRIGALIIELGFANAETVTKFATLQMMETMHALFDWKQGTYQFESVDVEPSPEGVEPIRAETVVMNGIRMIDEWPSIRERIPSYGWLVEPMRPLPPKTEKPITDELDFSNLGVSDSGGEFDDIGSYERRVYELVGRGRTVQELINVSGLGEFETCRSLNLLMGGGYIRIVKPPDPEEEAAKAKRKRRRTSAAALFSATGRIVVSAILVIIGALLIAQVGAAPAGASVDGSIRFSPTIVHRHVSESQTRVLRRALEVYRLQHGSYPDRLSDLVAAKIIPERDLRFPYEQPYFYRRQASGPPLLLPPIR